MIKKTHFIVIGSGISGLNFALNASKKGEVLIITKKKIMETTTNYAQGGIAATLGNFDSYKKHLDDTLKAGAYHNNLKALKYMIEKGPSLVNKLMQLGVPFDKNESKLSLTKEGGHSAKRIAHVKDRTGHSIEEVLIKNVRKNSNIKILENCFAIDLLVKKNTCYGIRCLYKNKTYNIHASAVIIATGGVGQVYLHTTNPKISTGDGIAMAKRAGAVLKDMEFIQFHPTALDLKRKKRFLLSEALRGEGAILTDSRGKRFMKKYHANAELAPRDIVSRAIFEEKKTGPVYLDISHKNSAYVKNRFSYIYKNLKKYGLDLTKDAIPVSPAAHYICGGIKVNMDGETSIKNCYAFGESACTGVHGANRLASNSLLEAIVFSAKIINSLKKIEKKSFPDFKIPHKKNHQSTNYVYIRRKIRNIMWEHVGIVRNEKNLKYAIESLEKIKNSHKYALNNIYALETLNMLEVSIQIAKSALKRKKSLGCHFISQT